MTRRWLTAKAWRRRIGLLALPLTVACQDAITDVGGLEDGALDDVEALEPLVNGMGRELSDAVGFVALTGAAISREVVGAGSQTTIFGVTLPQRNGVLDPEETDEHWNHAQQARWVAEDGVRRMRRVLGDGFSTSTLAVRALLHVGFANRLLGENMCLAVVDGGPPAARETSLVRAGAAFTEALEVAQRIGDAELGLAARAGRASVRVGLGDWTGARSDAEAVPVDFAFRARYSDREIEQTNRIHWATAGLPNRNLSVWSTFYEEYFRQTGDPRTPWTTDPEHPDAEPGVPFYIQRKYTRRDSPIDLVTGQEMRLVVAESWLRAGAPESALAVIDEVRALAGLEPWAVEGLEGTWTALKRERGIVLWLEGRRLGDLRRWLSDATPGAAEDMTGRDTCFPIGATEIDTNPNVP